MTAHEAHLRKLYEAISAGLTGPDLGRFFHPDAVQIEYPSLLRPEGHRRPLAEMLEAAQLGARIIRTQVYDVRNIIADGDQVAVQLTWTAVVAADVGTIKEGARLVSHVAAFYEFRDGLVLSQSSYDCYEPLPA